MEVAKDACEKIKRKRSSLVGAFVSTHGRSIDDVDKSILEAKTALLELTQDLTERSRRWRQIEMLTGVNIVTNPGLLALQKIGTTSYYFIDLYF
jgi:stromal interaction molecule 1